MSFLNARVIIATSIYVLLLVGGSLFVLKPLISSINDQITTLNDSNQQYQTTNDKVSQLARLNQTKPQLDAAKATLTQALPTTPDQDRLTLVIAKVATDDALKVNALDLGSNAQGTSAAAPATVKSPEGLTTLSGSIDVTGDYSNIKKLAGTLEQLSRLITITSIAITGTGDSTNTRSVISFTYYTGAAL